MTNPTPLEIAKIIAGLNRMHREHRERDEALLRQALEALESLFSGEVDTDRLRRCNDAVMVLRERLK